MACKPLAVCRLPFWGTAGDLGLLGELPLWSFRGLQGGGSQEVTGSRARLRDFSHLATACFPVLQRLDGNCLDAGHDLQRATRG